MTWNIFSLLLLIIGIILIRGLIKNKKRKFDCSLYQKRGRVMNESEQALFINLQKILGDEYIVLSKVRIEDFVDVKRGEVSQSSHWGLRGRIKSRHVDFLVCDRATTKPLLAIELDGKSHNDLGRQVRDQFVNDLYKAINLPIEHIHVGGNFLELSQKIKQILQKSPTPTTSQPQPPQPQH